MARHLVLNVTVFFLKISLVWDIIQSNISNVSHNYLNAITAPLYDHYSTGCPHRTTSIQYIDSSLTNIINIYILNTYTRIHKHWTSSALYWINLFFVCFYRSSQIMCGKFIESSSMNFFIHWLCPIIFSYFLW